MEVGKGEGRRCVSKNQTPNSGHRMLLVREAPNTGHCCSFRVLPTTRWPAPAAELATHFGCRMHSQTEQEMLPCWLAYQRQKDLCKLGVGVRLQYLYSALFSGCCRTHLPGKRFTGATAAWWEWEQSLSGGVRGISSQEEFHASPANLVERPWVGRS